MATSIPVISDAAPLDVAHEKTVAMTVPEIAEHADDVSALLAIYDAALEGHRKIVSAARSGDVYAQFGEVTLFANRSPNAEYALALWCSANGLSLKSRDYDRDGMRWHIVEAHVADDRIIVIQKVWPLEPELRIASDERFDVDMSQMWRPTDGGH